MMNATFIKGTSLPVRPGDAAVHAAGTGHRALQAVWILSRAEGDRRPQQGGALRREVRPIHGDTACDAKGDRSRMRQIERNLEEGTHGSGHPKARARSSMRSSAFSRPMD